MTPDQVRTKERELQERITNAQQSFRDRNRIIQETAQYSLSQIERTLIGVIRQVAESRGMNLVLHRAQVALNINEFDITDQVTQQMNKVMPSINIPPDGVSPLAQASAQARHGGAADAGLGAGDHTARPGGNRGVTAAGAGDARFFHRTGPHTLAAVAQAAGLVSLADDRLLHGVAPLQLAGPEHVSFLDNRQYAPCWTRRGPAPCSCTPTWPTGCPPGRSRS